MERADKIFVCLAAIGVIAVLIHRAGIKPRAQMPNTRLMLSEPSCGNTVGYAYLTSNLPLFRRSDDMLSAITVGKEDATSTGAAAA